MASSKCNMMECLRKCSGLSVREKSCAAASRCLSLATSNWIEVMSQMTTFSWGCRSRFHWYPGRELHPRSFACMQQVSHRLIQGVSIKGLDASIASNGEYRLSSGSAVLFKYSVGVASTV